MTPTEEIKAMAARLREMFPGNSVSLTSNSYPGCEPTAEIVYHGPKTYAEATDWFRSLGIQNRRKTLCNTYTQLSGVADGVEFRTYPDELPPTCRVEKYIEKIPKTETVTTEEFIEVERTRIVCGDGEKP